MSTETTALDLEIEYKTDTGPDPMQSFHILLTTKSVPPNYSHLPSLHFSETMKDILSFQSNYNLVTTTTLQNRLNKAHKCLAISTFLLIAQWLVVQRSGRCGDVFRGAKSGYTVLVGHTIPTLQMRIKQPLDSLLQVPRVPYLPFSMITELHDRRARHYRRLISVSFRPVFISSMANQPQWGPAKTNRARSASCGRIECTTNSVSKRIINYNRKPTAPANKTVSKQQK